MGVRCIVKSCDNKQGRPGNTMMFHRIPTKNADLMNRWLLALEIDPNTPVDIIKDYHISIPSIVKTGQSGSPAQKTRTESQNPVMKIKLTF
uniref:THAP-type domain-containing protein n=1 Tax=Cyprinus carpio carpio TaxID=630221 RepID=A0A9J8BS28_CYPCA